MSYYESPYKGHYQDTIANRLNLDLVPIQIPYMYIWHFIISSPTYSHCCQFTLLFTQKWPHKMIPRYSGLDFFLPRPLCAPATSSLIPEEDYGWVLHAYHYMSQDCRGIYEACQNVTMFGLVKIASFMYLTYDRRMWIDLFSKYDCYETTKRRA